MNQGTYFSSLHLLLILRYFRFLSPSWEHRNLTPSHSLQLKVHWKVRLRTLAREQSSFASSQVSMAFGSRPDLDIKSDNVSIKNTRGRCLQRIWIACDGYERSGLPPWLIPEALKCHDTRVKAIHADLPVTDMFTSLRGKRRIQV